ncbi:ionotropic receptor 75a-like [Temnothorax americanus]|uniref:ionotropic receptor 75a-like n=1 Tax=Temnothorax americanus TaxID=1964332 RepID=UPI0040677A85
MRPMYRIFLLQTFLIVAYAQTSRIIRDYFVYKNVTRVVGFSCGDMNENFLTMKLLTSAGMATAIKPAGSQIDIPRYLDTDRTLGVFVDMRCPNQNVSGIFDEGSAHRMYDYSYVWLIFGSNLNHSLQSLNDSGFSIVTDFAILLPNETDYVLYDVYNHCKMRGGALNVTWLGSWREDDGLTISLTGSKIFRRRDYHGLRAKAAGIVMHRPEHVSLIDYLEGDGLKDTDNWSKFGYILFSNVADMFNFTMDLIELNHWEKNDSNGPLMSTLKRDGADLAYYPNILTIERYGYARVILQQWPTRTCFMFRTIPATKIKPWIMLKPFAANTWYIIIVIVVVTILILSCILKLERADDCSCSISALIAVAALCQQGFPSLSDQSASRIALIHITVFGLLVYNYYGAAIVSARLNEPIQKMNDSLFSLVHSKMQIAAEKIVFFNFLLRNQRPDVQYFKPYWNDLPESKRFIPVEEGVERIKKGDFAYHGDPDSIYPAIEREFDKQMICQLTEVHLLQPTELGLWCNLKSHFHEISKIALLKISTSGLRRREIRRRSARRPYCPSDEVFVSSVTIYEAAPILFLLLFGMIISLIVFGIEHFVFYTIHSKRASGVTRGIITSIKPSIKPDIKRTIKQGIKQGIKPDVEKGIKIKN